MGQCTPMKKIISSPFPPIYFVSFQIFIQCVKWGRLQTDMGFKKAELEPDFLNKIAVSYKWNQIFKKFIHPRVYWNWKSLNWSTLNSTQLNYVKSDNDYWCFPPPHHQHTPTTRNFQGTSTWPRAAKFGM